MIGYFACTCMERAWHWANQGALPIMKACGMFNQRWSGSVRRLESILFFFLLTAWISPVAVSAQGKKHYEVLAGNRVFSVEIADQPADLRRGLMGREQIPPDAGLLMVMPAPRRITVWMKNMRFALDVVWISQAGEVLEVRALPPCVSARCPVYGSKSEARYLLEVGKGQFPLKAGQKVEIIDTSGDSLLPRETH